jgi:hypothetical protein
MIQAPGVLFKTLTVFQNACDGKYVVETFAIGMIVTVPFYTILYPILYIFL